MDEEASLSNEPPTENEKPQPQPQDGPHGVPIIRNSEFQNADGFDICCKSWLTETRPRGLVFMVHGYSEHCHRPHYDTLATALVALGCCVFTQDLVGHGKSSGPRAFVKSIDTYVEDVLKQADVTRRRFPRKPVYLFGYDMKMATKVLGNVSPGAPVATVNVNFISRDPEVVSAAANDPLRYHGRIPAGWIAAMLKAMGWPSRCADEPMDAGFSLAAMATVQVEARSVAVPLSR
ncbi:monoacylglycerol lipase-like [Haemaphysalis longicornis]